MTTTSLCSLVLSPARLSSSISFYARTLSSYAPTNGKSIKINSNGQHYNCSEIIRDTAIPARGLRAWHDPYVVQYKRCTTWEGIGISSYLLINFWYTRLQANKSAIKALTVNRVGDTFLSVGFFAMLWVFGNVDYATVFSLAPYTNEYALTVIGLLFLLAGMGKSAQLGLHTWLPDAMEGPTPVSALIHAANYMWPPSSLMI